jgi:nitric oxide reductase NorQ protein
MLIYAGLLIRDGVSPADSCDMTITQALTDDPDTTEALKKLVQAKFGN